MERMITGLAASLMVLTFGYTAPSVAGEQPNIG